MSKWRIYLPRPHPGQKEMLDDTHRFKMAACGRQWGKTTAGLIACVAGHGSGNGGVQGSKIWWVAPNYPLAVKIWHELKKACIEGLTDKSETTHTIVFPSGGFVRVRSADQPDSLRGETLDGVVIDEAAFCDKYVWESVLRPAISVKNGWAMFLSTPNGKNWFSRLPEELGDELRVWKFPSSSSPYIKPEEIELARKSMSSLSFAQEYMGEFIAAKGSVFQKHWFRFYDRLPPEDEIQYRAFSLDTAFKEGEHNDYSVCICAAIANTGIYIYDIWRDRCDFFELKKQVIRLYERDKPTYVIVEDRASGISLIQELKREGKIPVIANKTDKDKYARANAAVPILARGDGRVFLPRGASFVPPFLDELCAFPSKEYHDDQVDAFSQLIDFVKWEEPPPKPKRSSDPLVSGILDNPLIGLYNKSKEMWAYDPEAQIAEADNALAI